MSQYSWYGLENKLEKQFNEGKDFSNLYVYKRYVYLKDYLELYKKEPEIFSPSMVVDMSVGLMVKINALLNYSNNRNDKDRLDEQKIIFKNLLDIVRQNGAEYDDKHRSLVDFKGIQFFTNFSSDMSLSSSKGKSLYTSEIKNLLENLTIFNKLNWSKNIPGNLIFQNVEGSNLYKSISIKNLIISLNKLFPNLENDETYIKVKYDFFDAFNKKFLDEKNNFYHVPFNEVVSFLKDSYNKDVLKKVVVCAGDKVEYSYLKNKATFDKIISLNPEAKEILKDFMDAIKDETIPDFFMEEKYHILPFSVNVKAIQKILLLDKVKVFTRDISTGFEHICEQEKSKDNPLAWFSSIEQIKNDAVECEERWIFKVPSAKFQEFGDTLIRDFLKKVVLNYVSEYPKFNSLGKADNLWQEFVLAKDNESLPAAKNASKTVKF